MPKIRYRATVSALDRPMLVIMLMLVLVSVITDEEVMVMPDAAEVDMMSWAQHFERQTDHRGCRQHSRGQDAGSVWLVSRAQHRLIDRWSLRQER